MISVRPSGRVIVRVGKNVNVGIFSDTLNVINVKLYMTGLLLTFLLTTLNHT